MAGGRILARLGVGAAALVVGLSAAAPAFAAASGRIDKIEPSDAGHVKVFFSALGLNQNESIDLKSVSATIDGQAVDSVPQKVTSSTVTERRTMLTIDISGSMSQPISSSSNQTRIEAAKAAAAVYLKNVPKGVQVGLVTFADQAKVVVPPTTDIAKVADAVSALNYTPNGGTALFNAVILANTTLGTKALSNQLILSDGKNEITGGSTIGAASKSIVTTRVTVDAVSIGNDPVGTGQLKILTAPKVGNGRTVQAADTASLVSYFQSAADTQANQLVVDVTVPEAFAGKGGTVTINAQAGGQAVTASQLALFPASGATPTESASVGPVPVPTPEPGITSQPWFLPVAIGMVAVGLFGLLAVAFFFSDRDTQSGRVRRRLSRYSLTAKEKTPPPPTSGALGQSQVARSAAEFAGRVAQTRDLDTGLALRLEAAGVPLRPGEWMLIHIGIAILAGLVFLLLSGFGWFATLLGLVLGVIGPWLYLSFKEGKRKSRFQEQLPQTLQLMAGSLAAGYSLPQAVDTVVRESEGPMAVELNRALVEARLGVPIEDALETVAVRMDSMDFKWVVMALRIQREVGGNLAEVLTNVAATMRERERLRRQVDVLSAEGRLSAIILGALPLVFVGYLVLARPEYIGLLITTPLGILLIIVGVVLLIVGAFWLRKVVKVQV